MRRFRSAGGAAVVLAVVAVLCGCGAGSAPEPGGPAQGPGSAAPTTAQPQSQAPTPTPTPPQPSPGGTPPSTPPPSADPTAALLVSVVRSGGFAGRTSGLLVKGDGSWTLVDDKARTTGSGKLAPAALDTLRGALRDADLAHLPRTMKADPPVYDGFTYAFTYGGYSVAADQDALTPGLENVLAALPGFSPAP
ncbi:hypothetical protein OOK31_11030 [Streptomyces sp. NBC_00249]|uniref:hypothetical protein n=1 Tax=Streptomyces sp. NBC_00249 TaxID=2975690 RepID=UPI0022542F5A|nr:hypothetical protein [Streptomyces sp. NBC_00249]MCX5194423.1 hypothetical protein [Streptomyces sp. NBC_00249]